MVKEITIDNWVGNISSYESKDSPSFRDFEEYLNLLDGIKRTLISIQNSKGGLMLIGGGREKFVTSFTDANGSSFTLRDPKINKDVYISLVAGGQRGEYSADVCTPKDLVKKAVNYFFNHNEKDPELSWRNE